MKGLLIIIAVLLLSVVVIAHEDSTAHEENVTKPVGNYEMEDFAIEPRQALWLRDGDFLFFNLLGKRHSIRIDQVYYDNAKIVLYPDIKTSPKGAYAPIRQNKYLNIDLNKDDVADMTIRLNRVQGGDWGDEGLFVFESLVQEDKAPETQGMVVSDASKGNNLLIFVAAAIGGLLGLLVVFALKRKKTSM